MRPKELNKEIEDEILGRLVEGESLRKICSDEHMPTRKTFYEWLVDDANLSFRNRYAHARELQADTIIDEINDIADDATNDYMETVDEDGAVSYRLNGENIQRSRLRIDARKWLAGKLRPKKYGDRVEIEHSGTMEHKHSIGEMTDEQLARIISESDKK